jgi:hypothetical protein
VISHFQGKGESSDAAANDKYIGYWRAHGARSPLMLTEILQTLNVTSFVEREKLEGRHHSAAISV